MSKLFYCLVQIELMLICLFCSNLDASQWQFWIWLVSFITYGLVNWQQGLELGEREWKQFLEFVKNIENRSASGVYQETEVPDKEGESKL